MFQSNLSRPCKGETGRTDKNYHLNPTHIVHPGVCRSSRKSGDIQFENLRGGDARAIPNVVPHNLNWYGTDTECAVAALPGKIRIPWVQRFLIQTDDDVLICSTILAGAWFFDCPNRM